MTKKVKWGILAAASIARRRVVPAMLHCELAEVAAVGSRSLDKSQSFAKKFAIPKAYGSYEELLNDPEIEAIYNPLPNHLHVDWSIRAASHGKHVLCEKPLARNVAEARRSVAARDEHGVKIGGSIHGPHASAVAARARYCTKRPHRKASFSIVVLSAISTSSRKTCATWTEFGGGGLMDIGCYPIRISRFMFGEEPLRVIACIERDPSFQTDRLTSAILEFPCGQSIFTVPRKWSTTSTMQFLGTEGRVDMEIPFNAPTDNPCRIFIGRRKEFVGGASQVTEIVSDLRPIHHSGATAFP